MSKFPLFREERGKPMSAGRARGETGGKRTAKVFVRWGKVSEKGEDWVDHAVKIKSGKKKRREGRLLWLLQIV